MQAKDVPEGQVFYSSERIGDDKSAIEVREVFYRRAPPRACRFQHGVPIVRLGMAQGTPSELPRYIRRLVLPCADPGEIDGRTTVRVLDGDSVWASAVL